MKRYDSYKPSGIEWIGEIPSHWDINRLKFEIGLHGRIGWNGLRSDEFQVVSHAYLVTGQDFEGSDIPWDKCYQIDKERYEEDPFIQLKEGDILVTKDGSIGKVAMVRNLDKPACLNSGIFVLKQKHNAFNQLHLYWLLSSDIFKGFISYHQSGSTILHLYQNVFDNMPTVVPPMKEQIIMADYLDKKCGEIDMSIAKQQRRIELLEELKQSVITQAVTRGIDPSVPLHDSGVEWIGEIPEHWVLMRIKNVCHIFGRIGFRGYNEKDLVSKGEGAITLSPSNLQRGRMNYDKCSYLSWDKYYESPEIMIFNGDIIFVKTGSTYGKSALVERLPMEATINPQSVVLKNISINNKFLAYTLSTEYVHLQVENTVIGGTIPTISQDKINNYRVIIPPLSEQHAIADYLDKRCSEIDSMIEREKKKIELMQELKQSIITEVVTGKRKVV